MSLSLLTNDLHVLEAEVQVELGLLAHVAGELDDVHPAQGVLYTGRKRDSHKRVHIHLKN